MNGKHNNQKGDASDGASNQSANDHASSCDGVTDKRNIIARFIHGIACAFCDHYKPGEKKPPCYERINAIAVCITAFIVLAYTVVAGYQAYLTRETLIATRAINISQVRPWIRIAEAAVPDTNIDETSRIPYIFPAKVENVGNMPAVDVVPLGYSVVPIIGYWEMKKLSPVLYRNAQKICAKDMRRALFNQRKERMTMFPINGEKVPALSMPFRDIETTVDNFIDGGASIDALQKHGTQEAAVIFFVGYRSSIDDEIRCTAEAFFVKSTKDVLFTGEDVLAKNRICYPQRTDIEVDPHPIGIGFAD